MDMQYLIKCEDSSYCILYKRSIVMDENEKFIKEGMDVNFYWPEDSNSQKKYRGCIIKESFDEEALISMMDILVKNNKTINANKVKQKSNLKKNDVNITSHSNKKIKESLKRRADKIMENDIFKNVLPEIESQLPAIMPSTSDVVNQHCVSLIKSNQNVFSKDNIRNIQMQLDSCLSHLMSAQESLTAANKTFITFNVSDDVPNIAERQKLIINSRRSHNMHIENEDTVSIFSDHEMNKLIPTSSRRSYNMNAGPSTFCNASQEQLPVLNKSSFDSLINLVDDEVETIFENNIEKLSPVHKRVFNRKRKISLLSDSSDEEIQGNKLQNQLEEIDWKCTAEIKKEKNISDDENINPNKERIITLKYPSLDSGDNLQELITDSGIYVNKIALKTVKSSCDKQTTLARALMRIVFSEEALSKCTIRGKTGGRPGLDQNGINTILAFVHSHAKANKWKPVDNQKIITSLSRQVVERKIVHLNEV